MSEDIGMTNVLALIRLNAQCLVAIHPVWHLVARISWADAWGPSSVEDHPSFREREFAVVGQDYRRPVNLRGRQIRLSSPSWEDATPSIVFLECPPCRSRSMPIAVITSPGSGIG